MCLKPVKFKYIDLFGYPVRLRTSSRSTWEKDAPRDVHESEQRSWVGAVLTIIFFLLVLGRLGVEVQELVFSPDLFHASQITLPLEYLLSKDKTATDIEFDINDHAFLPSIDARLMEEAFGEPEKPKSVDKGPKRKKAFGGKYFAERGWCSRPDNVSAGSGDRKLVSSAKTIDACLQACEADDGCYGFFQFPSSKKCFKWLQPEVVGNGATGSGQSIECFVRNLKYKRPPPPDAPSLGFEDGQEKFQFVPRVDALALQEYINIQLKIRSVQQGQLSVFVTDFRQCTAADFVKKGLMHWQFSEEQIKQRLCPDINQMRQLGASSLRNTHLNETDHASFSIEVFAKEEKDPEETRYALESVFFTTYLVSEQLDLTAHLRSEPQRAPVMAQDRVSQQFTLRQGQFRQTNTMIQVHNVKTKDKRSPFLYSQNEFQFLQVAESQSWVADTPFVRYENFTSDGQAYEEGPKEALYRQHFSLSDTMILHTIEAKDVFGGLALDITLFALQLFLYFYLIAAFINKRLELGRYITKNHLIKLSGPQLQRQLGHEAEDDRLDPIKKSEKGLFHMKYRFRDIFFGCRKCCQNCCCGCCKGNLYDQISFSDKILEEGRLSIGRDMNIEHILQSIAKLKAGLGAVIGGNEDQMDAAKRLYFQNVAIYADERDKDRDDAGENPFYEFLQENSLAPDRLQAYEVDQFFGGPFDAPQRPLAQAEPGDGFEGDEEYEPQDGPPTARGLQSQSVVVGTPRAPSDAGSDRSRGSKKRKKKAEAGSRTPPPKASRGPKGGGKRPT